MYVFATLDQLLQIMEFSLQIRIQQPEKSPSTKIHENSLLQWIFSKIGRHIGSVFKFSNFYPKFVFSDPKNLLEPTLMTICQQITFSKNSGRHIVKSKRNWLNVIKPKQVDRFSQKLNPTSSFAYPTCASNFSSLFQFDHISLNSPFRVFTLP